MRVRRQRQRFSNRWIRGLVCLLPTLFVLVMFTGQNTLAFVLPYIDSDGCEKPCSGEEDEEQNCPCPIPCAPCCAGTALRAIAPPAFDVRLLGPSLGELIDLVAEQAPLPMEPAEILHVPKRTHA